jgi:hypothetical protein|tara:strand:+ start:1414 stop:1674 length:261 start_codon:yes stop_codon:yes gene_type:complete
MEEDEWWQEEAEQYSTRVQSMQEGLNRLWNEACYLTDEYKLTFSDVAMILEKTRLDIIELEIQEIEGIQDYDEEDDIEDGDAWKYE